MESKSRITEENVELLKKLYNQYKDIMYVEARRILNDHSLAEDAVHQAFMKIIDKLERIKDEDVNITSGFLIIVVRNIAIDMYNTRKKSCTKLEYIENIYNERNENFPMYKTPCEEVIHKESRTKLLKAIEGLPTKYRDVLILEKVYKYPQKEIAELLNISLNAVKKRAERAKKMLMEELRKEEIV